MTLSENERAIPPNFDYDIFELPSGVHLDFHLSPHLDPTDLPSENEMSRIFTESDAAIVELIYVDRDPTQLIGKIAMGDFKTYQSLRTALQLAEGSYQSWVSAFLKDIYGTRIPATTIDVNGRDSCLAALRKSDAHIRKFETLDTVFDDQKYEEYRAALASQFEAIKQRDQKILGNIKPSVERLGIRHRRLETKRQTDQAQIAIFYGTVHRSLLDAVIAKQSFDPTERFSASESKIPNTPDYETIDSLYPRYLRGLELSHPLLLRRAAYMAIMSNLDYAGVLPPNVSGKEMQRIFTNIIETTVAQGDLSDIRQVYEDALTIFRSMRIDKQQTR